MQISDIQNPAERKKLIVAAALGLVALVLLWWTFFGFGSSPNKLAQRPAVNTSPPSDNRVVSVKPVPSPLTEVNEDVLERLRPINFEVTAPAVSDAKRNIFAYYEPPTISAAGPSTPTPTPTPTPPLLLASLSPASVYARTGDFTLEVSGDKFTPQLRIVIDNGELATRYISPQQLSATVPAGLIANGGSRQVMVRSGDGKLYSNATTLAVNAPPTPNYTYVGIIGTRRYIDTAILQDKGSKEMLNVQRGDLLGGRFRVTSISEKELVLIDANLKIKHTLPFAVSGEKGNPMQRATPRVESDDDQP
ncbi:MAG: IPT/TIG domain-containing protein [bacterium]